MSVDFLSKNFPPFQVHHAKKPPRFYPDGFQRNVIDFYFIFSDCRLRKALYLQFSYFIWPLRAFQQNARSNCELFRYKNIHGIRHKLHIFANRLLLRRDIQQSQCRSNHRIKIDSMLCPDVRIHKYLNKHGIQPLRQQPVLTELRHRHAGQ